MAHCPEPTWDLRKRTIKLDFNLNRPIRRALKWNLFCGNGAYLWLVGCLHSSIESIGPVLFLTPSENVRSYITCFKWRIVLYEGATAEARRRLHIRSRIGGHCGRTPLPWPYNVIAFCPATSWIVTVSESIHLSLKPLPRSQLLSRPERS